MFRAHTTSGNLVGPFALFVVKKPFLDGTKIFAIGALNNTIGLWVVHRGEDRLSADGKTEIPDVLAIELFVVVDCEFGRDSEAADNVLLEEFFSGLQCYYGYCPGLNPLCEIFDGDEGELDVPLSCRQWSNDVQPPALNWPCMGDDLGVLRRAA
jgi:hypothetical protein